MPVSEDDEVCFKKSEYIVYRPYAGLDLAYHAKKVCFSGRSRYQKVDIIDNEAYGRMLLLDNNVQHTSYDARIFNEALCGVAKRNGVTRILILGGGSGQTVMSLLKSSKVEEITVVEIDELVVEACRKHIKGVKQAFDDSRVRVVIADAFKYIHQTPERFDAAIVDLTESPFGLSKDLTLLKQLYTDVKQKCDGRCSQYFGSSVGLAYTPRLRRLAFGLSERILSDVRYEEVFIPSFGAPHLFMHAGYVR
jgi:spermidine synthase